MLHLIVIAIAVFTTGVGQGGVTFKDEQGATVGSRIAVRVSDDGRPYLVSTSGRFDVEIITTPAKKLAGEK